MIKPTQDQEMFRRVAHISIGLEHDSELFPNGLRIARIPTDTGVAYVLTQGEAQLYRLDVCLSVRGPRESASNDQGVNTMTIVEAMKALLDAWPLNSK